jgi:hypothetical protein
MQLFRHLCFQCSATNGLQRNLDKSLPHGLAKIAMHSATGSHISSRYHRVNCYVSCVGQMHQELLNTYSQVTFMQTTASCLGCHQVMTVALRLRVSLLCLWIFISHVYLPQLINVEYCEEDQCLHYTMNINCIVKWCFYIGDNHRNLSNLLFITGRRKSHNALRLTRLKYWLKVAR